jgi:hypothetical protein
LLRFRIRNGKGGSLVDPVWRRQMAVDGVLHSLSAPRKEGRLVQVTRKRVLALG